MKRIAMVAVVTESGFAVGVAEFGVPGYVRARDECVFSSFDAAQARADELNRELGLSPVDAFNITTSSMFNRTR